MNVIKANTVQTLIDSLKKFDTTLPVAIFDSINGYMSVAFKKEETKQDEKTFQWLTFYPHETLQMYTIDKLISYLEKLPPQATVAMRTEELEYTSLYLAIDGMMDNKKMLQWLVIRVLLQSFK